MILWVALACGSAPSPVVETASPPADSAADTAPTETADTAPADTGLCAAAPVVTYASFGHGFMIEACQGCHASTAAERYGAPEAVTFDTVEQCWAWADRILARAAADDPTMPPQGGVSDDDRTKLLWWLSCAEPGT